MISSSVFFEGVGSTLNPIIATLNARDTFPLESVNGKLHDFEICIFVTLVFSSLPQLYTQIVVIII